MSNEVFKKRPSIKSEIEIKVDMSDIVALNDQRRKKNWKIAFIDFVKRTDYWEKLDETMINALRLKKELDDEEKEGKLKRSGLVAMNITTAKNISNDEKKENMFEGVDFNKCFHCGDPMQLSKNQLQGFCYMCLFVFDLGAFKYEIQEKNIEHFKEKIVPSLMILNPKWCKEKLVDEVLP